MYCISGYSIFGVGRGERRKMRREWQYREGWRMKRKMLTLWMTGPNDKFCFLLLVELLVNSFSIILLVY